MILQPPPFPGYQLNAQDESHLNTISICHFVMAGLYLLGIGLVIAHFFLMTMIFRMAENEAISTTAAPGPVIVENSSSPEPEEISDMLVLPPSATASPVVTKSAAFPKEIIPILTVFYVIFGGFLVTLCVSNVLSGRYIRKRKNRIFSFIIAGINCMQFPLGTTLGIFTFIVLTRDSVKMAYSANTQV